MEQNVYMISLVGISVVFLLLLALYFVMKAFRYLPSSKPESKVNKTKVVKSSQEKSASLVEAEAKNQNFKVQDQQVMAVITAVMAKKGISQDRISIKKIGG